MYEVLKEVLLNEKYFGKNPLLENIEQQLTQIKEKTDNDININPNMLNETRVIERMLEQLFNLHSAKLTWSNSGANAMTYLYILSPEAIKGKRKTLIKSKDGIKFQKKARVVFETIVDINLFKTNNMTPKELTAIILHEVGHQFQYSSQTSNIWLKVDAALQFMYFAILNPFMLLFITQGGDVRKMNIDTYKERIMKEDDKGRLDKLTQIISNIGYHGIFGWKQNIVLRFLKDAALKPITIVFGYKAIGNIDKMVEKLNPFKYFIDFTTKSFNYFKGYSDEKFSDSFATAYGYGPELSSAMKKLEYEPRDWFEKGISNVKIIELLYKTTLLPIEILIHAIDVHPTGMTRIINQIEQLEKELKETDANPEVKKAIQKDLDKTKEELDDFFNYVNNDIDKRWFTIDSNVLKKTWTKLMYKLFKTGNFREFFIGKTGRDFDQLN